MFKRTRSRSNASLRSRPIIIKLRYWAIWSSDIGHWTRKWFYILSNAAMQCIGQTPRSSAVAVIADRTVYDVTWLWLPPNYQTAFGYKFTSSWYARSSLMGTVYINNNNNNNNHDDIYSAVIVAEPLWEFTRFTRWIQKRRQVAADLWTKSTSLSRKPAYIGSQ